MNDLRETVSAAILKVMREDGLFSTGAFADAAIAAMQPTLDQLARERDEARQALLAAGEAAAQHLNRAIEAERQRDAALAALKVAREAIKKSADQLEFYAENHRRKNTKDGDLKAEVNQNLSDEMHKALAQIDAV